LGSLLGYFLYSAIYRRHSYQDIAWDIAVSNEWNEIPIQPDLKIKKQVQKIGLVVPGARYSLKNKHNFLPDGTILEPEVEIADKSGNWHRLRPGSGTVGDYDAGSETFSASSIDFTLVSDSVPRNTRFVAVRLRSSNAFSCSKVKWHDYYMK
jgi:hypothetical protein